MNKITCGDVGNGKPCVLIRPDWVCNPICVIDESNLGDIAIHPCHCLEARRRVLSEQMGEGFADLSKMRRGWELVKCADGTWSIWLSGTDHHLGSGDIPEAAIAAALEAQS